MGEGDIGIWEVGINCIMLSNQIPSYSFFILFLDSLTNYKHVSN